MQPTDIPLLSAFSLVTAEKLRNAGFTVEVQAMDWSTLTSRRASREPVAMAAGTCSTPGGSAPT
jgi:peptide/nickel transport system substrate-binding protein